jgi:hypothetical protein
MVSRAVSRQLWQMKLWNPDLHLSKLAIILGLVTRRHRLKLCDVRGLILHIFDSLLSISIKMDVCVSGHNSGTPGAISTKLGTHIAICMCKNLMYVLFYTYKNGCVLKWMCVCVCVCVCVCMSGHNSGTPGAISTKLGTHIAICMCKNLMYVLYIYIYPKHQFPKEI